MKLICDNQLPPGDPAAPSALRAAVCLFFFGGVCHAATPGATPAFKARHACLSGKYGDTEKDNFGRVVKNDKPFGGSLSFRNPNTCSCCFVDSFRWPFSTTEVSGLNHWIRFMLQCRKMTNFNHSVFGLFSPFTIINGCLGSKDRKPLARISWTSSTVQ